MSRSLLISLDRCVLVFRGADHVRFLNGQLSNDVRKLQPGAAMHACVMTAKGKMNAEVWLTLEGDSIRVDGPPGMGQELFSRFEKYVISDDVAITDETESWRLFHCLVDHGGIGEAQVVSRRFHREGFDLWRGADTENLWGDEWEILTPEQIESFRIEQGVPLWGSELGTDTLPVEAGLDLDCIDYHKGCYLGQEIISRIKSVGHVNRQLVRLVGVPDVDKQYFPKPVKGSASEPLGTTLYVGDVEVGRLMSCAPGFELENWAGLAYLKRSAKAAWTPGALFATAPGGAPGIFFIQATPQ